MNENKNDNSEKVHDENDDFCCAGKSPEDAKDCEKTNKCCENIEFSDDGFNETDFVSTKPHNATKKNSIVSNVITFFCIGIAAFLIFYFVAPKIFVKQRNEQNSQNKANLPANITEVDESQENVFSISTEFDKNKLIAYFKTQDSNFDETTLVLKYTHKQKQEVVEQKQKIKDGGASLVFALPENVEAQFVTLTIEAKKLSSLEPENKNQPNVKNTITEFIPVPNAKEAFGAFTKNLGTRYPMLADFERNKDGLITIKIDEDIYNALGNNKQSQLEECISSFDVMIRAAGYSPSDVTILYIIKGAKTPKEIAKYNLVNGKIK